MAEHDFNIARGAAKRSGGSSRERGATDGSADDGRFAHLPDEAPDDSKVEYRELFHNALKMTSVPHDAWMAFLFTLVQDYPNICFAKHAEFELYYRAILVTLAYLTNLALQLGLLYWICTMVTLPSVRGAQNLYASYHTHSYHESGEFDASGFEELPDKGETCQIALSATGFLAAIIFLWASQMFKELRVVQRRFRDLSGLPMLPPGLDSTFMCQQVVSNSGGHFKKRKYLFCCWNKATRLLVTVTISLPKAIVSISLMFLGSVWLASSECFADLILNSLALVFVTEIDELIFKIFLPVRLSNTLNDFYIALPAQTSVDAVGDMRAAYKRSGLFLTAVLSYTCLFVIFQPVVPRFAWDLKDGCEAYLAQQSTPFCAPFEKGCFPYPQANSSL